MGEDFDVSINIREVSLAVIDFYVANSADILDGIQSCDFADVIRIRQWEDAGSIVWVDYKYEFEFGVRGDSKNWLSVLSLKVFFSVLKRYSSDLRVI